MNLARLLLTHGFNVYAVYLDTVLADDKDDFYFLQKHYPELQLRSTMHFKRSLLPRDDTRRYGKVLAIGQMAAYFTDSNYFVNIVENSGLYGYTGLLKLISLTSEAFKEEKDMRRIVQIKAWGCHG